MTTKLFAPINILRIGIILLAILLALGLALFLTASPTQANDINGQNGFTCPPGTRRVSVCHDIMLDATSEIATDVKVVAYCHYECVAVPETGCDGGKTARRWNAISSMWERNLCDDLFYAVPTHDPFDAVFGKKSGGYGWSYGQAIAYLMSLGYTQAQLDSYDEQINALVLEGLWDPEASSVPAGADLSFLTDPPPDPGYLAWLPVR